MQAQDKARTGGKAGSDSGDRCISLSEGDAGGCLAPAFGLSGAVLVAIGAGVVATALSLPLAWRAAVASIPCVIGLIALALARAASKVGNARACFAGPNLTLIWPRLGSESRQRIALSNVKGVTVASSHSMERQRQLERLRGEKNNGLDLPFRGRYQFLGGYDAALQLWDGDLVALNARGHENPRAAIEEAQEFAKLLGLPFVEPGQEAAYGHMPDQGG